MLWDVVCWFTSCTLSGKESIRGPKESQHDLKNSLEGGQGHNLSVQPSKHMF